MNKIKKRVIELVRYTIQECSSTEIPNFDEICAVLELKVVTQELPVGTDGLQRGEAIIISSRVQNKERRKFTEFHELSHYLVENDEDIITDLHEYTFNQPGVFKKQLEMLCNIGAAEFLMPRNQFFYLYREKGFNVELILHAANYFTASTIAATIQLAQVAPNGCITTVWEYGLIPNTVVPLQNSLFRIENQSRNIPKLHVVYSASSPAASNRWLAKYTTFPDNHLINQVYRQSKPLKDDCYIYFPSWKQTCTCEAISYNNRVYAIFHLTSPPVEEQIALFTECF